jgi:hypothetical protein
MLQNCAGYVKLTKHQGTIMNEYEEEAWQELEAKQLRKNMDNISKILNLIDGGTLAEGEKASELIREIKEMHKDALRYRWLNKYTCQLFMMTEKGLDAQMDRAMGKTE